MSTDWDPISAALQAEERRVRRRIGFLTLIPIVVAAVLILVTTLYVNNSLDKLATARDSLATAQKVVDATRDSLNREIDTFTDLRAKLYAERDALQELANVSQARLAALDSSVAAQTRALLRDPAAAVTPRVYLHITREDQRNKARRVERYLERAGFDVPGIQRVRTSLSKSELRFFRSKEKDTAEKIQQLCLRNGYAMDLEDLSRRYENSTTIRPGYYEIWFGDDF